MRPSLRAPELAPHLQEEWQAFNDLGTCRPPGFGGLLPIPWLACDRYAERNGLCLHRLWHLIQKMDAEYLKHANKPAPKK